MLPNLGSGSASALAACERSAEAMLNTHSSCVADASLCAVADRVHTESARRRTDAEANKAS
jgi:hypothetical protein